MRRLALFLCVAAACGAQVTSIPAGTSSSGGGTGTVTSVTLAGTTNQITASGACTGTTSISCTLTLPAGLVLPGTVNGLTITTTTGTLTIATAKVLSVNNSLTLDGTDGVTLTFPATNATIARTDSAQTFTGVQSFSTPIATSSGGTGTALPPGIAGLPSTGTLVCSYLFNEGSGTTAIDYSGNGNNLTIPTGTGAMTWGNGGLVSTINSSYNQPLLPSACSNAKTIMIWVQIPFTFQGTGNGNNTLLGSSGGSTGRSLSFTTGLNAGTLPIAIQNTTGVSTVTAMLGINNPYGSVAAVYQTSGNDQFYSNGLVGSCVSTGAQEYQCGNSGAYTPTGQFVLFGGTSGFYSTAGTVLGLQMWSNQLTPQQIMQAHNTMAQNIQSRPINLTPLTGQSANSTVTAFGDSILYGYVSVTSWFTLLTSAVPGLLTAGLKSRGDIIGGTTADMALMTPYAVTIPAVNGFNPYIIHGGTNDCAAAIANSVTIGNISKTRALVGSAASVFLAGTMLSRTGQDTCKNSLNLLIRARSGNLWTGDLDFASEPLLGADGSYALTTWIQADGIHPTQLGQNLMAAIASRVINTYYGAGLASGYPTSIVFAASPYTEADIDVMLRADTTGGAITVNLPTAIGPTGTIRTVKNIGATNAVTLVPFGAGSWAASTVYATGATITGNGCAQLATVGGTSGSGSAPSFSATLGTATTDNTVTWTCNGAPELIDGATSVSIAAGLAVQLKDTLNSPSTGGAHWEIIR